LLNKTFENNKIIMENNKIVLAFSGGLDTSYCVKYLKHEKGFNIYSAVVNTGGFDKQELIEIKEKALNLGVHKHIALEQTQAYYEKIVKYLIFGNVLKNNTYPLSVSAERICQAISLIKYAKKIGAKYIAHGSTGAGNDQIRFDLVFKLLAPDIKIITPIRDQQLTRQEEIQYLNEHGINLSWEKAQYSINKGLWGTSVGGKETLTSHEFLPNKAFPSQLKKEGNQQLIIEFNKGEICAVDNVVMAPVMAIQLIEKAANKFAIGRDVHTGDTIIGIKGRVGFEAAAASVIIKAHHTLEKHTLSKWQLHWKDQLANWYGMFIHEAQYFEPVMRNIENFLMDTQTNVTGKVYIELNPYRFTIKGIKSKHDLMNSDFGEYGEVNKNWTGDDVKGFTNMMANSMQIFNHVNNTK
jgi:argininosuccinate synthase